jgi:adenine C2-methylase RlmN of 23S rRNA A2503 and tRNA A37
LEVIKSKSFANGKVYALKLNDGYLIETTDTFLHYYTKDAIGQKQNCLQNYQLGSRNERWMIGVSVMSGCPVRCRFCATGQMKKYRNLTSEEIKEQVLFIRHQNEEYSPNLPQEFKINYTRMGEPFLNIEQVKEAVEHLNIFYPNIHHYISTIGVKDSDFNWIEDNITLQISLHSLNEEKRNWLIPYKNKMSIKELGQIRIKSNLKTTLNLTLVDESDFDINILREYFDPEHFFIKLSPINPNVISNKNNLGLGVIEQINLV